MQLLSPNGKECQTIIQKFMTEFISYHSPYSNNFLSLLSHDQSFQKNSSKPVYNFLIDTPTNLTETKTKLPTAFRWWKKPE